MHKFDYHGRQYFLTLYYHGEKVRLRARRYHSDREISSWHIFSKSKVLEFTWSSKDRRLTENLVPGQLPVPKDFLELLQKEFEQMHSGG